jgi:hypothetical protein
LGRCFWKNARVAMLYVIPEPVPAIWFREGEVGIRRLTRSHDGARKGAVVASKTGRGPTIVRVPESLNARGRSWR